MPPPLEAGALLPAQVAGHSFADQTLRVVWVFWTKDCLDCQQIDYELRRISATHGSDVPIVALHLGSEDDASVPMAFLRQRRIDATLLTVSANDFRREFPQLRSTDVLIASGRSVRWVRSKDGPIDNATTDLALLDFM